MSIQIPDDIKSAEEQLGALGKLITASKWERAAIVYAFTREGIDGPRKLSKSGQLVSFREFADLGIHGLKSTSTVSKAHKLWADAIEMGYAKEVKPGDDVEIPPISTEDFQAAKRIKSGKPTGRDVLMLGRDKREKAKHEKDSGPLSEAIGILGALGVMSPAMRIPTTLRLAISRAEEFGTLSDEDVETLEACRAEATGLWDEYFDLVRGYKANMSLKAVK